ncbi:hypothetical protein BaRGS_00035459 [Batillaria attramentaria]|uniref:Uncharacterized protein n=1 Tax=Batillaria attramentaria TaxID=370345 RepID=A0ABD0JDY0_9CAEN
MKIKTAHSVKRWSPFHRKRRLQQRLEEAVVRETTDSLRTLRTTMCQKTFSVKRERVIPVIGKTGNWKSTMGNIQLVENKFRVGKGMSSTLFTALA